MKRQAFYDEIARLLNATITEVYPEMEESDAGASFSTGHDVQISPYMPNPYSLNLMEGDTFRCLTTGKTQNDILRYIENQKEMEKKMDQKVNSYKVDIRAKGESSFVSNGIRLPDEEQARYYGSDLWSRWSQVEEWHVSPSEDAPNHTADAYGRLTRIETTQTDETTETGNSQAEA